MNPVKEESQDFPEVSPGSNEAVVDPPRPLEALHETSPPPFLTKTYDMVDDPSTNQVVSWSSSGNSFVVWELHTFCTMLLPRYFKHNNFSSFVRQLNTYRSMQGFRKVDPDRWEFASEGFLRGQKHLLKTIKRRRPPNLPPAQQALNAYLEVGEFGLEREVDWLKRDRQLLMQELVKLRVKQQNTRVHLKAMEQRLRLTEQKQQQMMAFLARLMQNPSLLQQLVNQKERMKGIEEALSRKRRRPIDGVPEPDDAGTSGIQEQDTRVKLEAQDSLDFTVEQVSTSYKLAEQGNGVENHLEFDEANGGAELNDDFWQELLNEGLGDGSCTFHVEGVDNEDVDVGSASQKAKDGSRIA